MLLSANMIRLHDTFGIKNMFDVMAAAGIQGIDFNKKRKHPYDLEVVEVVKKKQLGQIIDCCIRARDTAVCADMLDKIKEMGYQYSTQASFSISVYDMTIPPEKKSFLEEARLVLNLKSWRASERVTRRGQERV